ncbi:MAG: hypothetical protein LAP13_22030 [Acidobacteriia bacterium]|nr:hypothetical protein [Terriglobia bacterium]
MIEREKPRETTGEDPEGAAPDAALPREPFPCPYCGQLLAPNCRVCVACKVPIDPTHIARLQRSPAAAPPEIIATAELEPPVGFPGRFFLIFLGVWIVVVSIVLSLLGPVKSQLALGGVQILTSGWVFYDAHEKGLPKPLRWGMGTLFLWLFMFPWYLVRRTRPAAPCPFVEGPAGPMTRALFIILLVVFFILILRGTATP